MYVCVRVCVVFFYFPVCCVQAIDAITPNGLLAVLEGRHCLTARSQCHLLMGDHEKALADAEAALEEDDTFIKGVFAKAEALYVKGDFEFALVYYHRGNKLRGELEEFQLGISKSVEAIENSIGTPKTVQLENTGDMTMFNQSIAIQQQATSKKIKSKGKKARAAKPKAAPKASDRTVKQLLGELYADKQYLEELFEDPAFVTSAAPKHDDDDDEAKAPDLRQVVAGGISYLENRSQFWRQQKPIYARVNERKNRTVKSTALKGAVRSKDDTDKVLQKLDVVEQALDDGDYERARMLAENLIHVVDDMHSTPREDKLELAAAIHSALGNAQIELSLLDEAEDSNLYDLRYSEEIGDADGVSRARANMGRVYARQGNYPKAVEVWTERGPVEGNNVENAWLHHELGRCYIEMEDFQSAVDQAALAVTAAKAAEDTRWILNSTVLSAQANVHNRDLDAAMALFNTALEVAKQIGDTNAQVSIESTMGDIAQVQVNADLPAADAAVTAPTAEGAGADEAGAAVEVEKGGEGVPDAEGDDNVAADAIGLSHEEYSKLKTGLTNLFRTTDLDNDGAIAAHELALRMDLGKLERLMEALGLSDHFKGGSGDRKFRPLPELFAEMDVNGDGTLTMEEFMSMLKSENAKQARPPTAD